MTEPTSDATPVSEHATKRIANLMTSVEQSDMPKHMQAFAIETVQPLFLKGTSDEEVARQLRTTFDKKYGPGWNCLVGRDFGAYVQHQTRTLAFFYVNTSAVLLFRAK